MRDEKRGRLNIQLLFILVAIAEIVGTILLATGLSALLEYVLQTKVEVHPLIWILSFGIAIGVAVAIVVNYFLLRPIVELDRAMKKVAAGDFTVRLNTNSIVTEIADSCHSFNLMVQELGATETLQSDFVSNVSHEFKTPINAIEGYATLLQGAADEASQQRYIDRILLNTSKLSTLVGNILLLSKISNHAIPMSQVTYRLDEQIRQAIVLLEPKWTEKNLDFDVELAECTWSGPESLMLHVWTNLLSNAIKFSPEGGLIQMYLKQTDSRFVYTIKDQGSGIPDAEQKHIFNKFYQLDSSHKQEGNGLGLSLCKQILDNVGGEISVHSQVGAGCAFRVALPLDASVQPVASTKAS